MILEERLEPPTHPLTGGFHPQSFHGTTPRSCFCEIHVSNFAVSYKSNSSPPATPFRTSPGHWHRVGKCWKRGPRAALIADETPETVSVASSSVALRTVLLDLPHLNLPGRGAVSRLRESDR